MTTQIDAIKELSKKKLLNSEQKKVLYKLFSAKIDVLGKQKHKELDEIVDKITEKVDKESKTNPKIKRILEARKQAKKNQKDCERELKNLHYSFDYNDDVSVNGSHPEIEKSRNKRDKVTNRIEGLKCQLLADIHGLPMTYADMTSYIEKEVKKIEAIA